MRSAHVDGLVLSVLTRGGWSAVLQQRAVDPCPLDIQSSVDGLVLSVLYKGWLICGFAA
jgi:hypothetical protein